LPVLVVQASWAEQPPVKREVEKAQRVKDILEKYPLDFSAEYSTAGPAFCNDLYGAMKQADKSIRYIEPVVRTDDPNHPALKQYHSCKDIEDPDFVGRSKSTYDDIHQIGDRGYRLYRLDLDGNPKNGLEEYLYAELDWKHFTVGMLPGYIQVDLKKCEFLGGTSAHQDQQPELDWRKDNYNTLIRYRGKYLIFDLYDLRSRADGVPAYILKLYRYLPERGFESVPACKWAWGNTEFH